MGGSKNMEQVLAIFRGLASTEEGRTACRDKDTLLTPGRDLQLLGEDENQEAGQVIFRSLRQLSGAKYGYTPCYDKTIALTLGKLCEGVLAALTHSGHLLRVDSWGLARLPPAHLHMLWV